MKTVLKLIVAVASLVWSVIIVMAMGLNMIVHGFWVLGRIIRQALTKKPACLKESPFLVIFDFLLFALLLI